jgi:cellulose synthase operon protein YhjQ
VPGSASATFPVAQQPAARPDPQSTPRAVSPFSQAPVAGEPARGRRAQDDFSYDRAAGFSEVPRAGIGAQPSYPGAQQLPPSSQQRPASAQTSDSGSNAPFSGDPAGPAWFYAPAASENPQQFTSPSPLPSVAETLQHSRERVAARWYALKGVFEPGEPVEQAPVRQKEIRTPVVAVFSLAGGVGKTSMVATIGRSLSSLGEKVLLTDTTSHGLLPFYFGASELRQGTVRTFSPPSGSTDAPIYLVSYEVGIENAEPEKEKLVEEILNNSRGTHRILLDLTVGSAWIIRYMARMSPTVLVPLAPDMNSVISLQSIEKFFQGMVDADGRPLQPFYLLNQFDVSLPLHLDVREVLRRQLGDRLLPFVIHRAPEVSEALAEGMTVVDYAPESPVSGDYMNVATWLRTVAAPATAGFRNVRWSER